MTNEISKKLLKKRNNLLESVLSTEIKDCLERIKLTDEFLEENKDCDPTSFKNYIVAEISKYKKFSDYCKDAEFEVPSIKKEYGDLLNKYNLKQNDK